MHNRAKHSNGMTGSLNLLQEKVAKAGLVLRRDRRKRVLLALWAKKCGIDTRKPATAQLVLHPSFM